MLSSGRRHVMGTGAPERRLVGEAWRLGHWYGADADLSALIAEIAEERGLVTFRQGGATGTGAGGAGAAAAGRSGSSTASSSADGGSTVGDARSPVAVPVPGQVGARHGNASAPHSREEEGGVLSESAGSGDGSSSAPASSRRADPDATAAPGPGLAALLEVAGRGGPAAAPSSGAGAVGTPSGSSWGCVADEEIEGAPFSVQG